MKRRIISIFGTLVLCLTLCFAWQPGKAEDCFYINVDNLDMNSLRDNDYIARHLSAQAAGLRVIKYISDSDELAARVRLTITQMDTNTLVFDKNYGYQSKTFDSGDIYLPYGNNRTVPYLVTIYIEDWIYAMPFMQLIPRLSHNGACTYGVRMSDYNPALTSNWLMGTMLNLHTLRAQGQMSIPIYASNAFLVGDALVAMFEDELTVSLHFQPSAKVEVHQSSIYCIPRVAELTSADPFSINQRAYQPGEGIPVSGFDSVLLYIPMSISYDSAGLAQLGYDLWSNSDLQQQLIIWNENLTQGFEPVYDEPALPVPIETEWIEQAVLEVEQEWPEEGDISPGTAPVDSFMEAPEEELQEIPMEPLPVEGAIFWHSPSDIQP